VSEYGLTSPSTHYMSSETSLVFNHLHWYWQTT